MSNHDKHAKSLIGFNAGLHAINKIPNAQMRVMVSSPAYFKEPVENECDKVARQFVRDHALPSYLTDHFAMMWNMGRTRGMQVAKQLHHEFCEVGR